MSEPTADDYKRAIVKFLMTSSLADHLGDVRDGESGLFAVLGISWSEIMENLGDWDNPYRPYRQVLIDHGLFDFLPDYHQDEPEDEDE